MPFKEASIVPSKPDISNGHLLILLRATQILPPILLDTKYVYQTSVTYRSALKLNTYSFTGL